MNSGCVNWPGAGPSTGWIDSGEGGLWAYVFFLADDAEADEGAPPFDEAHGADSVVALTLPDAVTSDDAAVYAGTQAMATRPPLPVDPNTGKFQEMFTLVETLRYAEALQAYGEASFNVGPLLLAALCIGTTDESLYNQAQGVYYKVTQASLTEEGKGIVTRLSNLYGRPARFVTYLDT